MRGPADVAPERGYGKNLSENSAYGGTDSYVDQKDLDNFGRALEPQQSRKYQLSENPIQPPGHSDNPRAN